MKKYLSSLIAIVIAVSLSAFTLNQTNTDSGRTTYWWYDADSGTLLNPGGKTDLPGNGCQLEGDPVCAFGHETQTGTPEISPDETAYVESN